MSLSTREQAIEGYLGLHFNQGNLFLKITVFFPTKLFINLFIPPIFPSMCKNKIFLIKREAFCLLFVSLIMCD